MYYLNASQRLVLNKYLRVWDYLFRQNKAQVITTMDIRAIATTGTTKYQPFRRRNGRLELAVRLQVCAGRILPAESASSSTTSKGWSCHVRCCLNAVIVERKTELIFPRRLVNAAGGVVWRYGRRWSLLSYEKRTLCHKEYGVSCGMRCPGR
jgi:hypothetical protein